ncbi:hypothetical protein COU57_04865 [Candidatus Pacearchaeota archaeon CG10_big_fil_rev_8_21_14_0_10_32_14]|nr:MAG: hypothetical protein COU57_04865 [Candidatus Pacearchaeota archaeon CG10_big_fil_rev_8_21_14_0_10_32_14]
MRKSISRRNFILTGLAGLVSTSLPNLVLASTHENGALKDVEISSQEWNPQDITSLIELPFYVDGKEENQAKGEKFISTDMYQTALCSDGAFSRNRRWVVSPPVKEFYGDKFNGSFIYDTVSGRVFSLDIDPSSKASPNIVCNDGSFIVKLRANEFIYGDIKNGRKIKLRGKSENNPDSIKPALLQYCNLSDDGKVMALNLKERSLVPRESWELLYSQGSTRAVYSPHFYLVDTQSFTLIDHNQGNLLVMDEDASVLITRSQGLTTRVDRDQVKSTLIGNRNGNYFPMIISPNGNFCAYVQRDKSPYSTRIEVNSTGALYDIEGFVPDVRTIQDDGGFESIQGKFDYKDGNYVSIDSSERTHQNMKITKLR